jgi:hypothetical protein
MDHKVGKEASFSSGGVDIAMSDFLVYQRTFLPLVSTRPE